MIKIIKVHVSRETLHKGHLLHMIRIFTSETQKIGELGEKIALKFLKDRGFVSRETNFYTKYGEIDIICEKEGIIHFVEVKTVSRETYSDSNGYDPEFNISKNKIKKMEFVIQQYIEKRRAPRETHFQIDVIGVFLNVLEKKAYVRYTDNVFYEYW